MAGARAGNGNSESISAPDESEEVVLAILGMLLCFLMFLVVVLRDSLSKYLDAKASELRARADSIRKEAEEK